MAKNLPQHAEVVVIGAGIVGCSVAYHLAKMGWKDVVVLERSAIVSGTTAHSAGLVTQLRHTRALTDISRYGVQLYQELKDETGLDTGFRQTGSISVARTQGRMDELRRMISMAKSFGVEMNEIGLDEAKELWSLMSIEGLVGAVHLPYDGETVPDSTANALATGATRCGAQIIENTPVNNILTSGGAVSGVATAQGDITCEVVVNCAGMWAREIGLLCGVSIPLHAADHAYFVTEPVPGASEDMPSLRDPDGYIYVRRYPFEGGGILIGGFEPEGVPWGMDGIPDDFSLHMLNRDWSHYDILMENAMDRVPAIADAGVRIKLVGPESFTPDTRYIMGEAPELRNFFVAAGFNSSGVASAAGGGQGYGGMDHGGGNDRGPLGGGHRSLPELGKQSRLPAGPNRGGPGSALRHALASQAAGIGPKRTTISSARTTRFAGRVLWGSCRMGAAQLVRPRGSRPRLRVLLGATELV